MKSAELTYMPIEWLAHHPENPRREIGNIKELTASIRESGVMQNLTVVQRDDQENRYWVVIGNRRLEAAKAAGLKEVPVYISDMDHKTQLATMMAENMQRVDLTLVEQAEGVQMMMDLGMTVEEVSQKTGLRRDTVERRRLLMKHDRKQVEAAITRGGSIQDFIDLEKVEDEEERKKLLGQIGKPDYRREMSFALERQKKKKLMAAAIAKIDQWATRIEKHSYVGQKVVPMNIVRVWWRITDSMVDEITVPEDIREVHYYWMTEANGETLKLLKEAAGDEKEDREERARRARGEWIREHRQKAEQVQSALKEKRDDWMKKPGNYRLVSADGLLNLWTRAAALCCLDRTVGERYEGLLKQTTGLTLVGKHWDKRADPELLDECMAIMPKVASAAILYAMLGQDNPEMYSTRYQQENVGVVHNGSEKLKMIYELLEMMGYEMSDEENAYMDGSHEIYCEWKADKEWAE